MTVDTLSAAGVNVAANSVVQQIWTNMDGGVLSGLTGDARYPFQPTTTRALPTFEGPARYGSYYGTRVRALVTPATTGSYKFYISSDDAGALLFSGTGSAAGAAQIASVTGYTAYPLGAVSVMVTDSTTCWSTPSERTRSQATRLP